MKAGSLVILLALLTACSEYKVDRSRATLDDPSSAQTNNEEFDPFPEEQPPLDEPTPDPEPPSDPKEMNRLNFAIGTIGDSISVGFNANGLGEDGGRYNWSTGSALTGSGGSHYSRFKALANSIGRRVGVAIFSEAAVGAEAIDTDDPPLTLQAERMSQRRIDYVTILIGDNDICQTRHRGNNFKNLFKKRVKSALKTLKNAPNPPQLILVSSIPNPQSLKLLFNDDRFSFEGLKCRAAWKLLCPNMQDMNYSNFKQLWQKANDALEEAVEEVGAPVVFDQHVVANASLNKSHVSDVDCFHPSVAGQKLIAKKLWQVVRPKLAQILRTP